MKTKKEFNKALQDIDAVYQRTLDKLSALHEKKMGLIKEFLQSDSKDRLKKSRESLKNFK